MTWHVAIPFIIMAIAFIIRMPIGLSMLIGAIAYFLAKGVSLNIFANVIGYSVLQSYVLIAIPLFVFTANIMNNSEVTDKIFKFATGLVGNRRGGTAYVNILASLIFAGMSGSALADASGLGLLEIEQMDKDGYDRPFACAITASTAVIGPIFPPSIPFVIFSMVSGASLGKLFMGGMIPAIILCIVMGVYVYFISKKRNYPRGEHLTFKQFALHTVKAIPALLTPVVLLTGIYTGVMTATEASAIAAAYTLLIACVVYRTLSLKTFIKIVVDTVKTTGMLFLIISSAFLLNYIVTVEKLPIFVGDVLGGFLGNKLVFLIMVNVAFLIIGCLMDVSVSQLVIVPIILPLVRYFEIDLIHFGVMISFNIMIGLLTPPFGMLLFVTTAIGKIKMKDMIRESLPLVMVLLVALAIITYIPETVLFATRLIK
jgi:tripartite ATP-independent transporter DctM subunit